MNRTPLSLAASILILSHLLAAPAHAQTAATTNTQAALAQRLDQLASELAAVKAELAALRGTQDTAQATRAVPAAQASNQPQGFAAAPAVPATANAGSLIPEAPATVLTSYGELNYNRYSRDSAQTQADVRRMVFGFQHRFDNKTKLVTEIEIEHAIASKTDDGEVAVEQAYVEHQFSPTWAARGGLFLMPAGLLNENHEPTAYYGVERNFVETAIIPSTWREGGVQVVGSFDNGLTLQTGVSTGFKIDKWDSTSTDGTSSPLGALHQEMAKAKSHDLAVFGALNWRGVPGLLLGGSLFNGKASQAQPGVAGSVVTLWDAHARWTPGRWDLSSVYARGNISNTASPNASFTGSTLIPESFDGFYAQAAYKLWSKGDYVLSPFLRWEQFNTGRSYADLGTGLTTPSARATEQVLTVGANFRLTRGVVLKADVQRFAVNTQSDRINLGLGWSF